MGELPARPTHVSRQAPCRKRINLTAGAWSRILSRTLDHRANTKSVSRRTGSYEIRDPVPLFADCFSPPQKCPVKSDRFRTVRESSLGAASALDILVVFVGHFDLDGVSFVRVLNHHPLYNRSARACGSDKSTLKSAHGFCSVLSTTLLRFASRIHLPLDSVKP